MRGVLYAIVAVLAGLALVTLWRAAALDSVQPEIEPAGTVAVDQAAVAGRLAESLTLRTISYLEAERWQAEPFLAFREFLRERFPRVHATLARELVGDHSLLYRWEGAQPGLDPVLLMAHYDVVPVEPGTEEEWTHAPFAGVVADGYVWGRGAIDNKSGVMAILEAVEMLLAEGHEPRRTVLLAFGHDEEIGGTEGAARIASRLEASGTRLELVLDEGGIIAPDSGVIEAPLALVGTAEKGYLSLRLEVRGSGGHSSQPPREPAVVILARAIDRLSRDPFPARYVAPTRDLFRFVASEMPFAQRAVFANEWLLRPLILRELGADPLTDAMIRTTTAPTMLRGSDKDNVLPARAEAVVNFRLLPGDTVEGVRQRVVEVIDDERVRIAPLDGFGSNASPVAPADAPAFETLARSIREIYPEVVVAPYLVVGATDARHYQPLSEHVYRFLPFIIPTDDLAGMHGTDERLSVATYVDGIRFYRQLIINTTR